MATITDSKCILVIGATSGIGRALALSLRSLPSQPTVIAAGRRQNRLDELSSDLETVQVDISKDREALKTFVDSMIAKYPDLDAVIFAVGIQRAFDFSKPEEIDLDILQEELNVNYIGVVTLIKYFLPHFIKLGEQGRPSFFVPMTSGLAVIPATWVPNYCASKSALHNLSLSLSAQLKPKNVHIMEILPPLVESELHDYQGTTERLSKIWMPLDKFTDLAMEGLKRGDVHIPIGQVVQVYNQYEEGKLEAVEKAFIQRKALSD